jgi:2-hydroxycyclohexanecarboxyl-CoA dehydrogenase
MKALADGKGFITRLTQRIFTRRSYHRFDSSRRLGRRYSQAMHGLSGQLAIVTGGAGAIGRAIGRRLVEAGCAVAIFDRDGAAASAAAAELSARGGAVHTEIVDITDHAAVAAAVADLESKAGPCGILINNAGWDRVATFLETQPDFWEQVIAVNLRGPLNLHHVVLPGMVARGRGRVVTIASDAGRVGSSGEAIYSACKGGMIAFTKTMARELAPRINLNVVCPGPTETPLLESFLGEGEAGKKIYEGLKRAIPFRRLGQPDDIAGIVAFLASDEASYITGQVISVSGGLTMHG